MDFLRITVTPAISVEAGGPSGLVVVTALPSALAGMTPVLVRY